MAKKKKHGHVNTKQSRAENYNKFLRGIDVLLAKMNVSIRTKDMPASHLDFLYKNKFIIPVIKSFNIETRKNQTYNEFVYGFNDLLTYINFKIDVDWYDDNLTLKVALTDWSNFGFFCLSALSYIKNLNDDDRSKLDAFTKYFNTYMEEMDKKCSAMIYASTMIYSDLSKEIIWGKMFSYERPLNKPSPYFRILGHIMKIEQKTFLKNEFNRIGCKVYNVKHNEEPVGIKINLKNLGIGKDKEVDVYFQKHVYDRLYERLDAIDIATINMDLIKSLNNVEYVVNNRNSKLIVYKYLGKTLGYFTFRILQDAILCSTFLFITNDSTPEGEKLNELTHLQKADKQYLKLDKLSAFAASDLRDNPKLLELFKKAGCAHLFEVKYKPVFRKVEFNKMADKLINYIDTDDEEEDH